MVGPQVLYVMLYMLYVMNSLSWRRWLLLPFRDSFTNTYRHLTDCTCGPMLPVTTIRFIASLFKCSRKDVFHYGIPLFTAVSRLSGMYKRPSYTHQLG
jgi:hypothetical protein